MSKEVSYNVILKGVTMETIIVRDPVCGMEIYPDNAAGTSVYQGQIYYFCSPGCKEAFDKEPERYIGQSDTE